MTFRKATTKSGTSRSPWHHEKQPATYGRQCEQLTNYRIVLNDDKWGINRNQRRNSTAWMEGRADEKLCWQTVERVAAKSMSYIVLHLHVRYNVEILITQPSRILTIMFQRYKHAIWRQAASSSNVVNDLTKLDLEIFRFWEEWDEGQEQPQIHHGTICLLLTGMSDSTDRRSASK